MAKPPISPNETEYFDGRCLGAYAQLPRMPIQTSHTNFPTWSSKLIGRESAVRILQDLSSLCRVVTVTGPAGIGKTVLALETAHSLFPGIFEEGWFVELASLSDSDLVPSAVALALGLRFAGVEPSALEVARAISGKKLLLVLDNCEHVIDAVAGLAEAILRLCPGSVVLATSREDLRIDGEHVYRVPPLDVPPLGQRDPDQLLHHSAAALFFARARGVDPNFALDQNSAPVIAGICRHLDGIPLAIEFAAAQADKLGVQEIAMGLKDRFDLLTNNQPGARSRHHTLRATLDWSYDLLPEAEAAILRRLAVLAGEFPLDAAIAVADDLPAPQVVDRIGHLVAKSLLIADLRGGNAVYRLLETTRLYALEKLRGSHEYPQAARRHAEYYLAVTAQAEAVSEAGREADWLAAYGQHLDNLRVALDWAFSLGGDARIGVALTVAVVPLWFRMSLMKECCGRVEQALTSVNADINPRAIMRLNAARAAALLYTTTGAAPEVGAAWSNVLASAEQLDDTGHCLWARWGLWNFQLNRRAFRASLLCAQQFSSVATNPADLAIGERMTGISLHFLGEQVPARQHLDKSLERHVGAAVRRRIIRVQYEQKLAARAYLPRVMWLQGLPDQAMSAAESVVRDAQETGHALSMCLTLSQAACTVALLNGDLMAARRFVGMLLDCANANALDLWRNEGRCHEGILLAMRGDAAAGLRVFCPAAKKLLCNNTAMNHTGLLVVMAGVLAGAMEIEQLLEMVDDALVHLGRAEERWCLPELLRVQGELLLRTGAPDAAEVRFRESLDIALRQEEFSWALRTATSFARLLCHTKCSADGRTLLAPVYRRFVEGFGTADLLTAKQLLDELA
jgi:predicted ATPase